MQNRSRYIGSLGFYLFMVSFFMGLFAIKLVLDTYPLWHGGVTQGVVVGEQTLQCGGKSGPKHMLTVQFIDRAGQPHTSTTGDCSALIDFDASPGSSISIVYSQDHPTEIASTDQLFANAQYDLIVIICCGFITLLLPFWIRKRMRRHSLPQAVDAGSSSGQFR